MHQTPTSLPLSLKAGRQNKEAEVILETFLGGGTQWCAREIWTQLKGKAGHQHECKVRLCMGRLGGSTRRSHQDPGSSYHPPKDKEEGKAKPALVERLHCSFPETRDNVGLTQGPYSGGQSLS